MSAPSPRRPDARMIHIPTELKIVDMSHLAEREAIFRSEKKIQEPQIQSSEQLNIWGKMRRGIQEAPKKIWNNLTKQYQKNKELRSIREQIDSSGQLYQGRGDESEDARDSEHAVEAVLARFDRSYDANDVLTEGESIEHFTSADKTKDITELRLRIYQLISEYAHGSMTDVDFLNQKKQIFDAHFHGKKRPSVSLYADNALEIAQVTRAEITHLEKIKDLDITVGRARSQYKSETVDYTITDKTVDFLQKNRVTEKIPPSIISAGVAAAIGVTVAAKGMATGLARAATFGVGGGVVVGAAKYFEESKRLKDERRHVTESMARGEFQPDTAERRKELAAFALEMVDAEQVIASIQQRFFTGETLRTDLNDTEQKEVLQALGDIEGRIRYNDLHNVDTISYGGSSKESLHTKLMVLRAKVKVQFVRTYGVSKSELEQKLETQYIDLLTRLDVQKEAKDDAFTSFRRNKALKEAIKGGIKGVMFGAAIQEATAFFNDEVDGVLEKSVASFFGNSADTTGTSTTLEGIRQWLSGSSGAESLSYLESAEDFSFILPDNGSLQVSLPTGYEFATDTQTGDIFLTGPNIDPIRVEVDPNTGMFTSNTLQTLRSHGFLDLNSTNGVDTHIQTETRNFDVPWSEIRPEDVPHIDNLYIREHRPVWLGNDTSGVYEFNERRAYWGRNVGEGRGFAADGSAQMRIDMREFATNQQGEQIAGSTHRGIIGRPGAAVAEGRMYWEITPERGGPIFRFPFVEQADGSVTAEVPPDHPAFDMLFGKDDQGNIVFKASLAEVVEQRGNDGERPFIYASVRGTGDIGDLRITEEIITEQQVFNNSLDLTRLGEATNTDVVPIIPVYPGGRRELEKNNQERILYGSITHIEKDRIALYEKNRSETLKQNPDAVLDHYIEAEMYMKKWSKEYSKKIAALEAQIPAMSSDTKLAICIPAAGHQEQKNIYEALKNYTYQTTDKKEFEITVFVNNPQRDKQGRFMPKDASAETLREIERFKHDFPDMQVNVMYMALEPKDANIGSIRKMLTDTVLKRHHARGKDVPDLIFASNDADNLGVSPEYVAEMLLSFEDPNKETILGNIDWDPEAYIHYPEVHVGTRLFQYLNAIGRKRSGRLVTSGANSAYRASMYAGIGGYIPEISGAEDIAIGQAILAARGNKADTYKRVFGYANKAMIYTSARRAIDAWTKYRRPALMQWNNEFTPFDDLRTSELDRSKPINFDDLEVQKNLKANFEAIINQTFDEYESGETLGKDATNYKKVLQALGIRYRLNSQGNVEITDFSRYIENMKQYQQEAVLRRDTISGKVEAKKQLTSLREQARARQEQEKIDREVAFERESASILAEPLSFVNLPDKTSLLTQIQSSTMKETIDGYTFDKEHPIKQKSEGAVYFAEKNGDLYVIKIRNTGAIEKDIEALGSHISVEQYLRDQGFTSDSVVIPEHMETRGDEQISVYTSGNVDLDTYLRSEGVKTNPKDAVAIIVRIAKALHALHKAGVVHGDIAPSNIIIDGTTVRLADLEDASIKQGKFANRRSIRGNRFAMPPEMLSYKSEERKLVRFDERADIYQSGATLYHLLTGNWPYSLDAYEGADNVILEGDPQFEAFQEERLQKYYEAHMYQDITFPTDMPAPLRRVLRKAMASNPSARYQSMAEFGLALINAQKQITS